MIHDDSIQTHPIPIIPTPFEALDHQLRLRGLPKTVLAIWVPILKILDPNQSPPLNMMNRHQKPLGS